MFNALPPVVSGCWFMLPRLDSRFFFEAVERSDDTSCVLSLWRWFHTGAYQRRRIYRCSSVALSISIAWINLRAGVRDFLWFQLCKGLLFIYLFITENVNSPRVFCSCRRTDLARTESQTLAAPILPPLPLGCRCNWWPTGDRWADVRVHVFIRQSTIWLEKARPDQYK